MGQKYPKRANRKQWLKLFVLTFAVADAAGIYVAHKKLNAPVPGSMQDEMIAYADRAQSAVPHVVSVAESGATNVAVNDPAIRVNPELRFAPDHVVPALVETSPVKQFAKAELPAPAFGSAAQRPAPVALATPAKPRAAAVIHSAPAPQTAVASFDKPTARLTAYVPAQRQIAALGTVHTTPATAHAVPGAKHARMAASAVQTILHHTASSSVHHNRVQQQAPSFSAAFADMAATTAKSDQSASIDSDWTPALSDFQHVATAPSALDLQDSSAPVQGDHAVPSTPAPSAELPAVSPEGNGAG